MQFASFSFIFIGDTHGYVDDLLVQKDVLSLVHPDYILIEQLEDEICDSHESYQRVLEDPKFAAIHPLLKLCAKRGIRAIGIDFKDFGIPDSVKDVVRGQRAPTPDDEILLNRIQQERAKLHLSMLRKYQAKTKKPLVICIGTWHLRKEAPLMQLLSQYSVVYPCDLHGNLLVEPTVAPSEVRWAYTVKT